MNRLQMPVTTAVVCLVLASCGKTPYQPLPAQSMDQQLAGTWKLSSPPPPQPQPAAGVAATGAVAPAMVAPRILKLQVNRNGVRQADYCDIAGKGQGVSEYSLTGDVLAVKYYTAKKSEDSNELVSLNENTFSGKVTRIDKDGLELDGKLKYVRLAQAKGPGLDDDSTNLCK